MAEQLTLDLPTRTALDRGDFFVSDCNILAMGSIENWQNWPGRKHIISGPKGAGKTHLAHVWADLSGATIISASDLVGKSIDDLAKCHIAVDDVPLIAGNAAAETALFHLHNLVLANGNSLLLTGRKEPHLWEIILPDLLSRLQGTGCATLTEPDDALFMILIAKLFSDRQMFPAPDVLQFVTTRLDRSFAAAQHAVAQIDTAALAQKRPISRPFVAQLLEKLSQDKALP